MHYKVCITAAGRGERNSFAAGTNKALLPIGHRAALSRIIEWFPPEIEIVIAVGHEAQKVKDFVSLALPERRVTFVDVDNYAGPGSGPGYSLLSCREHLECPFVLVACDTLVLEPVPLPDKNWIGVAPVEDPKDFLVAELNGDKVTRFFDKQSADQIEELQGLPESVKETAFIGLAGINDYEIFWTGLAENENLIRGERQNSNGLNTLVDQNLEGIPFTWFDIGTDDTYQHTSSFLGEGSFFLRPKEFLYIEGDRVVKYFKDPQVVENRVIRGGNIKEVSPPIIGRKANFFSYRFVPGKLLAEVQDPDVFRRFLGSGIQSIWKPLPLAPERQGEFRAACHRFYYDKTIGRVDLFFEKSNINDGEGVINGISVPPLTELLENVDWGKLADGVAVRFHGDPQPENIIYSDDGRFIWIDWRQDFAGLTDIGDLYYDLGKIYQELIVAGAVLRANRFEVHKNNGSIQYNFFIPYNLMCFREVFEDTAGGSGWDMNKVKLMTALIYLNIAPLHDHPYDQLLYYHGKLRLHEILEGRWVI